MEQKRDKEGWSMGEIVRFLREEQQISLRQLSYGLCSVTTLSRIECNEREMSMLLAQRILGRLGYQPDKYELYCGDTEFEWYEKRSEILRLRKQRDFSQMKILLRAYENEVGKKRDSLQEQFIKSEKAILELEEGRIETGIQLIKEAISLTVPEWEVEGFSLDVLALEELRLFCTLADAWERATERGKAYPIWKNMIVYLERHERKKEQMAEIYTYVIAKILPYLLECKMEREGLELCEKGLATVSVVFRMNSCCELLYWKARCIRELYRQKKVDKQKLIDSYQSAYYIGKIYGTSFVQEIEFYRKEVKADGGISNRGSDSSDEDKSRDFEGRIKRGDLRNRKFETD